MDIPGISPFMFQIGPIAVRWYGFFMAVSIAIGFVYMYRQGRRLRLSEDFIYNIAIVAVLAGIVGARLVYVLTNLDYFTQFPAQIIRLDMGGLSFHGGILGGVLAAWWYAARNRVPMAPLLDLAVPGIATGILLVRIGNVFNREILGFTAEVLGGARHPAQLYGSAIGLVLLLIFWYQTRWNAPDGYRFWSAVLWYSVLRFINEFFRVENPHFIIEWTNTYWGVGAVTLTQWLTPLFLIPAWYYMRRSLAAGKHWRASKESRVYQPAPEEAAGGA